MTKSTADYSSAAVNKGIIPFLNGINQDYVRNGTPISLTIRIPGLGEITCTEVFRSIQGKRLVCLGEARGEKVIVKLYFSPMRARVNWKRSHRGCSTFIERRMPAPGILFSGFVPEHGLYAMVFEYLTDAVRIDSALEKSPDVPGKERLLDLLLVSLADLHEKGLLQEDLHLGNFMIRGECIYALDGDRVATSSRPIKRTKSLKNLARLLANIPTTYDKIIEPRIMTYMNKRGWDITDAEVKKIKDEIRRIRWTFLSEYLSKINRTCDPFLSYADARTFSVFDRHHIDVDYEAILKSTRPPFPGKEICNIPGYSAAAIDSKRMLIWSSTAYGPRVLWRLWPAGRVWKNALMLRRLFIGAPQPIAIVLSKGNALRWDCSVFFKDQEEEGIRLSDLFITESISGEDKDLAAECLADSLSLMNGMGIYLGRIRPEEILVSGRHLVFFGLNAVIGPLSGGMQKQSRALHAFLLQWQDLPEIKDLLFHHLKKRKLLPGLE